MLVSLMDYFYKRRAIASSISDCGSSLGGIVLPVVFRKLLDEYSFSGGILLTTGVMLQTCVCSSLLTPIESYCKDSSSNNKLSGQIKPLDCVLNCLRVKNRQLSKNGHLQTGSPTSSNLADAQRQGQCLQNTFSNDATGDQDQSESLLESLSSEEPPQAELKIQLTRQDVHEMNSPCIEPETDATTLYQKLWSSCQRNDYIRSASFWVLSLFFFCGSIGASVSPTYTPLLAAERGLSPTECAYLLSILNILDIISHLLPGVILNFDLMGTTHVSIFPMFAVGFVSCLTPLLVDYG